MKDYYLFSKEGSRLKITKSPTGNSVMVEIDGGQWAFYEPEVLIKELEELVLYLKKYGSNGKKHS